MSSEGPLDGSILKCIPCKFCLHLWRSDTGHGSGSKLSQEFDELMNNMSRDMTQMSVLLGGTGFFSALNNVVLNSLWAVGVPQSPCNSCRSQTELRWADWHKQLKLRISLLILLFVFAKFQSIWSAGFLTNPKFQPGENLRRIRGPIVSWIVLAIGVSKLDGVAPCCPKDTICESPVQRSARRQRKELELHTQSEIRKLCHGSWIKTLLPLVFAPKIHG